MSELKILAIGVVAVFLLVIVGALIAGQRDANQETRIAVECLNSGGQWVTNPVSGNPSNHDCVRKD